MEEKMLVVFAWLLVRLEHNNNFKFSKKKIRKTKFEVIIWKITESQSMQLMI